MVTPVLTLSIATQMTLPLRIFDFVDSSLIKQNKETVNQLWSDLKDLADDRSSALASAKEIHTFDRDAGDAKERVQVHEAVNILFLLKYTYIAVTFA